MAVEVEIRSFITKEKYDELIEFFKKEGEFVNEDDQTTYYFDAPFDLRIQKNNFFSKVWMKGGKIHDEFREESEIRFDRNDFERLEKMFLTLGYNAQIKWFRKRHNFKWQGTDVSVDFTKGYGYIIEFEKVCEENEKEKVLEMLKEKLQSLNISFTSREEFDQKFNYYKEHWQELLGGLVIKIYFAGSMRGGRTDLETYTEIFEHLKNFGEVLTRQVVSDQRGFEADNDMNSRFIHKRDLELLNSCDVVVAEVSTPSLGVGFNIAKAVEMKKPVLCLFRPEQGKNLSAIIAGSPDITVKNYENIEEAKVIISEFLTNKK